jgi:hypothetical protein
MAVTRVDYPEAAVAAAWSVLLELAHLLGEYRDSVERDANQPFIYRRRFSLDNRPVIVQLDLLSGEYGGTGRSRRTQQVQDARPRKARGADLACEQAVEVEVSGTLPDGGADKARIRVAGVVPFIVMKRKSMALRDRLKEKDAYELHYCLLHYPGAPQSIVDAFLPDAGHGLVREALACLAEKFESPRHVGPKFVADFLALNDPTDREQVQRDVYERMAYFLAGARGRPAREP